LTLKVGYITDEFSTLSGLASVAYGSVDSFREVQNQIIANSPTQAFDPQLPSDFFQSFLGSEDYFINLMIDTLLQEYNNNELFADYVDEKLGVGWERKIRSSLPKDLYSEMDSLSEYGNGIKDYLVNSLKYSFPGYEDIDSLAEEIISDVVSDPVFGQDVNLIASIAGNNPHTKISVPPKNTTVPLLETTDLDKDFKGISFTSGYLTPQSYYSDIAYPGFEGASSVPASFKDSIFDGYVGYPSGISLETIFNPSGAESLRDIPSAISSVLADSDVWNAASVLGQLGDIPGLNKVDRDIYEISLIGPRINDLLTYDPATMSNGDYFDTGSLPKILNADKEDGVPMSSRKFSNTF
jgi:hypothetical protein